MEEEEEVVVGHHQSLSSPGHGGSQGVLHFKEFL